MPFDPSHVDLLLQYVLLLAGAKDKQADRQLGPIHLIKYVYLADLVYARRNQGKTFTSASWQFDKFGPWSREVHERIEPALTEIGAGKKTVPGKYEDKDEGIRWSLREDRLLQEREWKLPTDITLYMKRFVDRFGQDVPSLLDHVYSTKPMLSATPYELLDFSLAADEAPSVEPEPRPLKMDSLSEKKKKKLKERMQALQEKHKSRKPKALRLVPLVKNPRVDAIYEAGIAWLDGLAGQPLTLGEKAAEFSDEVWQSSTRKGGNVS
jgi:hypothetical protein